MDGVAGNRSILSWIVNLSVLALVIIWLLPTVGLFVSSFRSADQISSSGWWRALGTSTQNVIERAATPDKQVQQGDVYVIEGKLIDGAEVQSWGISSRAISDFKPG
ncbi:MAG: carbohydrate ABC transporter permease, partial [Pseudomonadota bacterium]